MRQHVQQNSKNRTEMAQSHARYEINLELSYIRHQCHPTNIEAFSPLPSSLNHVCMGAASCWGLASRYFLLATLIQICSPQFWKLFMQNI